MINVCFSMEPGVRAGVHITTLPGVPLTGLEAGGGDPSDALETDVCLPPGSA